MVNTISKSVEQQWVRKLLRLTPTFSWQDSRKSSLRKRKPIFKSSYHYIYAISMIYSLYFHTAKRNLSNSWPSYHKTIKFTEEHSRNEIIFLDTYVKRDKDSLYTDLYVKETATQHSYLHYTSCHPKNCTRKAPYGNSLRIKHNCAKSADFEKHSKDMKMHYANRGYPDEIIVESYQKARNQDHHELIHGTKTKAEGTKRIPLFLTYNPLNPNLLKIIKKH